jgi:hypothetical protein
MTVIDNIVMDFGRFIYFQNLMDFLVIAWRGLKLEKKEWRAGCYWNLCEKLYPFGVKIGQGEILCRSVR